MAITFYTGDRIDEAVYVKSKVDGSPIPVNIASAVTATFKKAGVAIGTTVTMLSTDAGSDWSTGLLRLQMTEAETATLPVSNRQDRVRLEVQIIDPTSGTTTIDFDDTLVLIKQGVLP